MLPNQVQKKNGQNLFSWAAWISCRVSKILWAAHVDWEKKKSIKFFGNILCIQGFEREKKFLKLENLKKSWKIPSLAKSGKFETLDFFFQLKMFESWLIEEKKTGSELIEKTKKVLIFDQTEENSFYRLKINKLFIKMALRRIKNVIVGLDFYLLLKNHKEFKMLVDDPLEDCTVGLIDSFNLYHWQCAIMGSVC